MDKEVAEIKMQPVKPVYPSSCTESVDPVHTTNSGNPSSNTNQDLTVDQMYNILWKSNNTGDDSTIENTWESKCYRWMVNHKRPIKIVACSLLLIGYFTFFIAACIINFERATTIFILTMVVLGMVVMSYIYPYISPYLWKYIFDPIGKFYANHEKYMKWVVVIILLGIVVTFLLVDQPIVPARFISFGGLLVYILLCYIFSKHRRQIRWRPVLWGITLQFVLGVLILRTQFGYAVFSFLGNLASTFLNFANYGSRFVFGDLYEVHFIAFRVLPLVIFFSAIISFLYYVGAMQAVIKAIARVMQVTMQTSATESLNAAGNIFVGLAEAPLLIRPFLSTMSKSELHAVMAGGFATIAGSVLGAYISMGIPATHLLTASFMSAPAALAIAKLLYPETEKDVETSPDDIALARSKQANFFEALADGASAGIPLVANIAANLIVFVAILAFLDGLLSYFGGLVDYPQLTFRLLCSYILTPFALLMGVEVKDAPKVGLLLAEKTMATEFVAYSRLSGWISSRLAGNPVISQRSEVIAAYALCGFSSFTSLGTQIGALTPMCPQRKGEIASIAFRALCSGIVACFMTACLAGMLYNPEIGTTQGFINATTEIINATVTPSM